MSPTLWQALLAVSKSPVDAGWLGIAFALGVVASFVILRWRGYGDAVALPVEDDELAFVEQVVGRASTPPAADQTVLGRHATLPPPLPSPALLRRSSVVPPLEQSFAPPGEANATLPGDDQSTFLDLKLSDLLAELESESEPLAVSEEVEDDQTGSWSRSELLQELASDCEPPLSTVAPLRLAERPGRVASLRGVDVAAVRRRLQHGERA